MPRPVRTALAASDFSVRPSAAGAFAGANYMSELVAFINRADPPKYDLIKVAWPHHRFA